MDFDLRNRAAELPVERRIRFGTRSTLGNPCAYEIHKPEHSYAHPPKKLPRGKKPNTAPPNSAHLALILSKCSRSECSSLILHPSSLKSGTIEHAQQVAALESPRTTKLYDRTSNTISLVEMERVVIGKSVSLVAQVMRQLALRRVCNKSFAQVFQQVSYFACRLALG